VSTFALRHVTLQDGRRVGMVITDGVIAALGPEPFAVPAGVDELDGRSGAVLPGLADHHLHLLATVAAAASVPCGPPGVASEAELAAVLRAAPVGQDGWVRAIGYDDAVAGPPNRHVLDRWRADVPVRMAHRSGALWLLNSAGLDALAVGPTAAAGEPAGLERDSKGHPTGLLWRADGWLRSRLPAVGDPDLGGLGRRLAGLGITHVTDATADLSTEAVHLLAGAADSGLLPQHVLLLGCDPAALPAGSRVTAGPKKIILGDHDLPDLDQLSQAIAGAHAAGRAVALHVVTDAALALALAAFGGVGTRPGDRLEHAALLPIDTLPQLRSAGLRVVTQPGFLADRGDRFLADVPAAQHQDLYRFASLLAAEIPVAASSDAPYGPLDPWAVLRAARDRRSPDGQVVAAQERVSGAAALAGYLSEPGWPGGPPRRLEAGGPADLVLLHTGWPELLADPSAEAIRLVAIDGQPLAGRRRNAPLE
jgi:predicted amidohydrolase YtcJ